MSESQKSEYEKEVQWRKNIRAFAGAMVKHWLWWLSSTIGSGIASFVAAWLAGREGGKMIPFWVYETAVATGLIVAAFRAFCDQRRIAEKANEKATSIEKTLTEAHAIESAGHRQQVALMANQVQTLQSQLDDRVKRKRTKDELANLRVTIQNLISQLYDITYYEYTDKIRLDFEAEFVQFQNTAYKFVNDKIGRSEATTLVDAEKIQKVNIPPETNFQFDKWRERFVAKQVMFNRLKFMAEHIENIEEKLDSKDFILALDNTKK